VTLCLRGYFLVLFDSFYFLEVIEPAVIDAGTFLGCFVPRIGAFQIAWPKRPASALPRPDWINNTFLLAFAFSQKYTVFGAWLFDNRCAETNTS
jgi:hypothetical protein